MKRLFAFLLHVFFLLPVVTGGLSFFSAAASAQVGPSALAHEHEAEQTPAGACDFAACEFETEDAPDGRNSLYPTSLYQFHFVIPHVIVDDRLADGISRSRDLRPPIA